MKKVAVRKELLRLTALHGGILKPQDVVDAARSRTSPLHSYFEWNNDEAAEAYRLWQARQLISVTVEYSEPVGETVNTFVNLKSTRKAGGGYQTMVTVLSDKDKREQLLEDAKDDMKIFQRKYKLLKELVEVFAAMKRIK